MIRFVDLGRQLGIDDEWPREFCFYDTVTDRFLIFSGTQTWETRADFARDFERDSGWEFERFDGLIADDWPNTRMGG